MKTKKTVAVLFSLIILLVCFLPGWGQETTLPDTVKKFNWETDTNYNHEYLVIALLGIYKAYEKECYNDSSLHKEYISYVSYNDGKPVGVGEPIRTYYIHREPTFKGFIEFLRKKKWQGKKSN